MVGVAIASFAGAGAGHAEAMVDIVTVPSIHDPAIRPFQKDTR